MNSLYKFYGNQVLQDIELKPDYDELAVQAIRDEANALLLPKVGVGGYVV